MTAARHPDATGSRILNGIAPGDTTVLAATQVAGMTVITLRRRGLHTVYLAERTRGALRMVTGIGTTKHGWPRVHQGEVAWAEHLAARQHGPRLGVAA